jgi:hypothetical protein
MQENGSEVGIRSTLVIDVAADVTHVVTYTWENKEVYWIRRLSLSNLAESLSGNIMWDCIAFRNMSPME